MILFSTGWFSKALLEWFSFHGRHHLPWQQPRTPYRVWVSEIMLQQTQVQTVIPYFERFLSSFPDLFALATAPLDTVLGQWTGLGYYARARNLHKAAQQAYFQYQNLPSDFDALTGLPGIGPSTAGAILSLGFNRPAVVLDANIKRTLIRFYGISAATQDPKWNKKLWELAEQLLPKTKAAEYTQAFMDIGALICTPKAPSCVLCPLKKHCKAFLDQKTHLLPLNLTRKARPQVFASIFILHAENHVVLEKRPPEGLWGGLWSFPETREANLPVHPTKWLESIVVDPCPLDIKYKTFNQKKHIFTHYTLCYSPIHVQLPKRLRLRSTFQHWHALEALSQLGLSGIVQKNLLESMS